MTVAESFDPSSPEVLAEPHAFFSELRRESPAWFHEASQSYFLSRLEDVRRAARTPSIYSSNRPVFGSGDAELEAIQATGYAEVPTLTPNDPPIHTRYRKLVNRAFAPRAIESLEPAITEIVNGLIDRFLDKGETEFIGEFAALVPGYVIADALGIPRADQTRFMHWADDILETIQYAQALSRDRQLECKRSFVEFQHYFAAQIEARRADPGTDMISDLVTARIAGERPLSLEEILDMIRIFLVAGNETTASWIAGTMLLLLDHPHVLETVRADRSLVPPMLEEALRIVSPARWAMRTIKGEGDVLHDVPVRRGARARILWASANRDEAAFPEPDAFDITRDTSDHVAFGYGVHYCLGAQLARAEARIAFNALFDRLDDIALAVPRERVRTIPMAGVTRLNALPFRFTARHPA